MPEQNEQENLYQVKVENSSQDTPATNLDEDDSFENLTFREQNKQLSEKQKKFNKEGPGKVWRIIYFILLAIVLLAYFGIIPLNIYCHELILAFLIIGSVIQGLFLLRKKNKEKIIENKRGWMAISTIIVYIIIPINLYFSNINAYGTANSFMISFVTHMSELETNGTIEKTFLHNNLESIKKEIWNIANEKAGYNLLGEEDVQVPKEKLGSDFWDEVFNEFDSVLLEKLENGERTN